MKEVEAVKLLTSSTLFDDKWYMESYPDVAMASMSPALHYLKYGWLMGRDPSLKFSNDLYIANNKGIKEKTINPLLHYLTIGEKEGRNVYPASSKVNYSTVISGISTLPGDDVDQTAIQLEKTQASLEYYFQRCQELEFEKLDA